MQLRLSNARTHTQTRTECFIANKFSEAVLSGQRLSPSSPLSHPCSPQRSHSPRSSPIPIISSVTRLPFRTVRSCACACSCVLHANEVRAVCIFKLVGQRGGEKVTGNERCLTAAAPLMRVSPRSAPTGVELTSESEISLKFYLSYLWAFAKCCLCRQSE